MTYSSFSSAPRRPAAGLFFSLTLSATIALAGDKPPLVPGATIQIADSKGKFDFLEVDTARHRLLAAHEEDATEDVIDLNTNMLLKRIKTGDAVGAAVDPKTGKYFVSVQAGKRVAVVDSATLVETGSIATEGETDAIIFDTKDRRVYVTNDNGKSVWAIDADSQKVVATIAIPGAPECMAYDPATDRIYLNIKDTDEVVVINTKSNTIVAHWSTSPATRPHGVALDAKSGRLFSAGDNGILVVIDTQSGKITASSKIAKKVDQIAFDPSNNRVYCAGAGWMSVVAETSGGVALLGEVKTAPSAKNVAVDQKTHAVWTTFTDGKNAYAKSWVLP